jgi:hypothetical protein
MSLLLSFHERPDVTDTRQLLMRITGIKNIQIGSQKI